MPRLARIVFAGIPHHITQRGNRRADAFFDDADRTSYLRKRVAFPFPESPFPAAHKVATVEALGADAVIDKSSSDLWREAERLAPGGYDVVLDANGVETLWQSYRHVAPLGRLVVYGFASMLPRGGRRRNWLKLVWHY